ncbi:MAG: pilus assembly protein N-terminal domain-containing protein, partial [Candidatus Omnitrophica bacterium]|nr:pilus assembly protein N-terminal domain-containing protein [Candidatus Omnitrophota bacterium]
YLDQAYAGYIMVPQFLCDLGVEYYEKGDYSNALHEFKKALIANPEAESARIARWYIELIETGQAPKREIEILPPVIKVVPEFRPAKPLPQVMPPRVIPKKIMPKIAPKIVPLESIIERTLDEIERQLVPVPVRKPPRVEVEEVPKIEILKEKLILDEKLRGIALPLIELELNQALIIEGRGIGRYLATSVGIIEIERLDLDQIKVTGKKIGSTYLHIWDQNGRWTLNIKVIHPRYIQELVETYRRRVEEAESFKFHYSFNRNTFHKGKRFDRTKKQSLVFDQWFGIAGETPYGEFDTTAQVSKLKKTTNLSYYTLGLTDASIAGFKDFDMRGFDYTASFSNLSFPGESLRGVRLDQRIAEDKISYTAFWGREGQGRFGRLSPDLASIKRAYITGGQVNFSPSPSLSYKLSAFHGYGSEREDYLRDYVVDLELDSKISEDLNLGSEIASDSDSIAFLMESQFSFPKLNLKTEFRNIEKNFLTITGKPSRSGELGLLTETDYLPRDWLSLSGSLDLYRDRLFPNPDHPDRLNVDLHTMSNITINQTTSTNLNYQYVDEKGKLSPRKAHNFGVGLSKRFPTLQGLATYLNYQYRDSKNLKSPSMDYHANTLLGGLSFKLIGDLSYYLSKEISWLTEESTGEKARPHVLQTGLDYSSQVFKLPLYLTMRLSYRDEEDARSVHSFLAGEDSFEVSQELSYRPHPDFELFASTRLKNIWRENPDVEPGCEAEIRFGGRFLWDSGFRWNPRGTIAGSVFKDLNDDGQRQEEEPGIENVNIFAGKRETSTDKDGFYKLRAIRGKKATVGINTSTLPLGYVARGFDSQEVEIEQAKTITVNFSVISRSEIYGVVFEDVDGDGRFGVNDQGVARVELVLETGRRSFTDQKGQYYFRRVTAGEHTIVLDINSLPVEYLPTVPLTRRVNVFEGITFVHNIPLKKAR